LAASVEKVTGLIEQGELNAVEPVKKRNAKQPSKEEELCALNAELNDFNCEGLDQMDINK